MARRISLSRAARLVGVKRGTLQQQIRAGELKTFEGEILLPDLLQAYPDAEIEDSSMLERVEQIIEQASFINPAANARKPDNLALIARVMSLSRDLSLKQRRLEAYRRLATDALAKIDRLAGEADALQQLRDWLTVSLDGIEHLDDTIDRSEVNETFLRVMSAQASVIPSGHEFFIEGAESILEAGLRGGLALDYGCSNGNCGLCKMRVVSGETRRIRHHDYSLTEAEKGLGYILGCCNTAITDIVIEADEASGTGDIPLQTIPLRLKKIEPAGDEVLILSTRTPRTSRLRFLAGQRAELSVDHVGTRSYPIASCPCDDMNLQFHISLRSDDPVATYLAESARVNDILTLRGPSGDFALDEDSPNSLLFVAEGIGFGPVKGLIEHAMALDAAAQILLVRIAGDATPYLNNLCRAWNDALDNFTYLVLDPSAMTRLEDELCAQLPDGSASGFDIYACGSEALHHQLREFASRQALAPGHLSFESIDTGGRS